MVVGIITRSWRVYKRCLENLLRDIRALIRLLLMKPSTSCVNNLAWKENGGGGLEKFDLK